MLVGNSIILVKCIDIYTCRDDEYVLTFASSERCELGRVREKSRSRFFSLPLELGAEFKLTNFNQPLWCLAQMPRKEKWWLHL